MSEEERPPASAEEREKEPEAKPKPEEKPKESKEPLPPALVHSIGQRDGIAYVFAAIRMEDNVLEGLKNVAEEYQKQYGDNPHVQHFLKRP